MLRRTVSGTALPRNLIQAELESGPLGKNRTMKRKRFAEEQIVGISREGSMSSVRRRPTSAASTGSARRASIIYGLRPRGEKVLSLV